MELEIKERDPSSFLARVGGKKERGEKNPDRGGRPARKPREQREREKRESDSYLREGKKKKALSWGKKEGKRLKEARNASRKRKKRKKKVPYPQKS